MEGLTKVLYKSGNLRAMCMVDCTAYARFFPRGKAAGGVKLTTHFYQVPKLVMCGTVWSYTYNSSLGFLLGVKNENLHLPLCALLVWAQRIT